MKRILISIIIAAAFTAPAFSQTTPVDKDTIAMVLGKPITVKDKDKLNGLVFGALLEKYAKENKIEPTEAELDVFVQRTDELEKRNQDKFEKDRKKLAEELKSDTLTEKERKEKTAYLQNLESILKTTKEMAERGKGMEEQMKAMKRSMAQHFVMAWKINKSLYEKYGGRIIFQQAGVEPLDAYRKFLKEQEKKGAFQILNKEYEPSFWKYFTDDNMHTFYSKDDGAKLMETPWWLMEKPIDE
ncbi:hypothetical protein HY086_00800 [Candidatus Gottesmanbacteria bacterium]|nr:hypothetical protein [Nitrospirota bacterium]MBI3576562.1 hypothetical protein [Candidatus Gottesmanbacteria bacterium]